jgi:hypothetical protein
MASLLLMPLLLPSGVVLLEYYSGWTEQLHYAYGNISQYSGNGVTSQIHDLNRGSLTPWAKPRILRILGFGYLNRLASPIHEPQSGERGNAT